MTFSLDSHKADKMPQISITVQREKEGPYLVSHGQMFLVALECNHHRFSFSRHDGENFG